MCYSAFELQTHTVNPRIEKSLKLRSSCLDVPQREIFQMEGMVEATVAVQPKYGAASLRRHNS